MSLSLATYMVPLWPEGSTAECGPQRRPSTGFDRIGTFMELYVIAGPNGAGNTTFAREFLPNFINGMVDKLTQSASNGNEKTKLAYTRALCEVLGEHFGVRITRIVCRPPLLLCLENS